MLRSAIALLCSGFCLFCIFFFISMSRATIKSNGAMPCRALVI